MDALLDGRASASSSMPGALAGAPLDALEVLDQARQRVGTAIEHEIVAQLAYARLDLEVRHDLLGVTSAQSRPASTQWCRKTEFNAARAAGLRPNETFEMPSDVSTPGSSRLIRRMPSIVSVADVRNSASPVASVNVSASKISAPGGSPYSPTTMS